jgi:pyruvate-ferredoxin/flavodoxin oxidoreductase
VLARCIQVWALDTAGLARSHAPLADLEVRMRGVALAGVFLRVSPFASRAGMKRDEVLAAVGGRLQRFFGKRGRAVVDANLSVVTAAYDGVINVNEAISTKLMPAVVTSTSLEAVS